MDSGEWFILPTAMKRTDPQSIRQIIDMVLDRQTDKTDLLAHRASYMWSHIVGPGINRHTTRRYVKDAILHVYLDSAPLKSELEFQKTHIVDAINRALGQPVLKSMAIH